MRCDTCTETLEIDDIPPDCEKPEGGCLVKLDALGLTEQIVLMAYNDIMIAGHVLGPETIIRRHKLYYSDIDLLVALIDERAQIEKEEKASGNNKAGQP